MLLNLKMAPNVDVPNLGPIPEAVVHAGVACEAAAGVGARVADGRERLGGLEGMLTANGLLG
jgi:hypothetical protein